CVLRIDYLGRSVLLCGDIEGQAMGRLIASRASLGTDIIVAPHHGSYSPNLNKFMGRVSPEYVVVSAERKKLGYYDSPGKVLSTSQSGAISLTIGKGGVRVNEYLPYTLPAGEGRTTRVIAQ
ncbi:MAG: hypothetical protein ACK4WF_09535, partial [Candidatus Brocadiales bacterium]